MATFTTLETKIIIGSQRKNKFVALIDKINKRAAKIGVPQLKYSINPETIIRQIRSNNALSYKAEFIEIIITGNIPVYNGWSVIAIIDHLDEGAIIKNLTRGEFIIPEFYRERGSVCDHCKTKHKRTKTILIKKNDELMQVGSSCINSFVEKDVLSVVNFLTWEKTIEDFADDEDCVGSSYNYGEEIEQLVATSIRIIKSIGFKKSSEESSTKDDLLFYYYNASEAATKFKQFIFTQTADLDIEAMTIEFVNWVNTSPANEFINNLKVIVSCKFVAHKYWGFIAGGVAAYLRSLNEKKETDEVINEYLPGAEVGKRLKTKLILDGVYPLESYYGISYRHVFHDEAGRNVVWFSTGKVMDNLYIGKKADITASVKKLGEYKGVKQTVLTRVRWC